MKKNTQKAVAKLPFAFPTAEQQANQEQAYNLARPKPENYADRTWPPPRGTRRSMGKR
ncbi:MAG: hypothetical protein Q4D05_08350 [Acinetobacter sp.]|nr:hypothetical protein [Acinetobacter sp.]